MARDTILSECLSALDGEGPKVICQAHLACVVDWALRERHRGDELERTLKRHMAEATQAIAECEHVSEGVEILVTQAEAPGHLEH